eukprot:6588504-Heterocapsa_arctica.AAC.1
MKTSATTTTMATDNIMDFTGCASNGVANMILATTNQNGDISGGIRPGTEPYVQEKHLATMHYVVEIKSITKPTAIPRR